MMLISKRLIQNTFEIYKNCERLSTNTRFIYTNEHLSVSKYVKQREVFRMSLQASSLEYRKKQFKIDVQKKTFNSFIFLNQFTQFMHMIDNNADDLALLEKAVERFKQIEIENIRRNSMGSMLMKMLHHFQNDELAQKFYSDRMLREKYFDGKQSILIFFDLLYKRKKYSEILHNFEVLKERLEEKQLTVMRSLYILIFATCYQQNTLKSFEYAKNLNEQYKDAHITQDHLIYLSALALNQNAANIAEELLSTLWPTSHIAIPSLRIAAMLQMRKFVESLQILRSLLIVHDNNRTIKNEVISKEIMKEATSIFQKSCDDERLQNEFNRLKNSLETHGYITEKSLNELVIEPFRSTSMTTLQKQRTLIQTEFNRIL